MNEKENGQIISQPAWESAGKHSGSEKWTGDPHEGRHLIKTAFAPVGEPARLCLELRENRAYF